jgi:hypothetical protein
LEVAVKKKALQLSAFSMIGMMLTAIVVGYLLVGGKDGGAVRADAGVTTEKAAASAGAQVLPTDPKLTVEPK